MFPNLPWGLFTCGVHYGKLGPIDRDVPLNEILEGLAQLDGSPAGVLDVTEFLRFQYDDPLSEKLTVGYTVYRVYSYVYPVICCFNCWNMDTVP